MPYGSRQPYGAPQRYEDPLQQYGSVPAAPPKNGMGIAGFVCGLVSLFIPFFGLALAIPGLIFSIIGMQKLPKGLAIAGFILSIVTISFYLIAFLAFGASVANINRMFY